MNFYSEGVVWTLPFDIYHIAVLAEEPDLAVLRAVYGMSYELIQGVDEEHENPPSKWIH